ncbi:TlpA family protein disulfide reductase [Limibacterium fermenti]|uniref:TlpA family protein disulfide reductase n=1 Tax=Limibacterium fermenti TaxID=3229863 RepID=UPI003A696E95
MRRFIFLALVMAMVATNVWPQQPPPLVLQGQFADCPERELYIFFQDIPGKGVVDTIRLDAEGRFYLKTHRIARPQKTNIQRNQIQLNDLYVAPGYELTITGNARDFRTLLKTVKITGKGSESNRYGRLLTAERIARNDSSEWYTLKEDDFFTYLQREQQLTDSIYQVAFGRDPGGDPYFSCFAEMTRLDNLFLNAYMKFVFTQINRLDADSARRFIACHVDARLLKDINNEACFVSDHYKEWFVPNYLEYLMEQDYHKDSTLRRDPFYSLKKTDAVLKGKIRDYTLFRKMLSRIRYSSDDFSQLNKNREAFRPYLASFGQPYYKETVQDELAQKEQSLYRTQKGQPAPAFTLLSDAGEKYTLSDFKGRVVYLDFWASWCGPCRAEVPAMKRLYEKYRDDERLAIIGIDVKDGKEAWLNALAKDTPLWLQLYDARGEADAAYNVVAIPKYILIDKNGHIADFHAPNPSDTERLNAAIDKLLNE